MEVLAEELGAHDKVALVETLVWTVSAVRTSAHGQEHDVLAERVGEGCALRVRQIGPSIPGTTLRRTEGDGDTASFPRVVGRLAVDCFGCLGGRTEVPVVDRGDPFVTCQHATAS